MMAPQNYIGTAKDKITVSWSSDCSLSWDSARELLVKIENGVAGSWKRRHDKFLSISELLKDSTAVSGKKLAFYIPRRLQSEKDVFNVITQLVIHLPLTLLNRPGSRYIVNMCQIGFIQNRANDKAIPEAKQPTDKNKSGKVGRKCILDCFSNIPGIASELQKPIDLKHKKNGEIMQSPHVGCQYNIPWNYNTTWNNM